MEEKVTCWECQKKIDWDEYFVNWGACSDCLNKSYDKYLREQKKPPAQ